MTVIETEYKDKNSTAKNRTAKNATAKNRTIIDKNKTLLI